MSLRLKVIGGTLPSGSQSPLCASCRSGMITRQPDNKTQVYCTWRNANVPGNVVECNKYRNAAQPTLDAMEEIAWRLVTTKGGRETGFVNATKFEQLKDEGRIADEPGSPSMPNY